jgi:putative membrane protein
MTQQPKGQGSAGDHLANERTFLAWIRTSIGIMAFGFVVVKFSLFLKQISLILGKGIENQPKSYSSLAGIVLVIVGALTAILSYMRYKKTEKQLNEGSYISSSSLITILTAFIFLVSIFLIIYLIKSVS